MPDTTQPQTLTPDQSGVVVREVIAPAVTEAAKKGVELYLDSVKQLGNRNPATVLVATLLGLLAVLGIAICVGVWVKIQQDRDTVNRSDRIAAEQREAYMRLEDARDRDRSQTTSQIVDMANRAALANDRAVEAQREASRVMLMVKGAIDEFRAETRRTQDFLKEQKSMIEKMMELLKVKEKKDQEAKTAPMPREAHRTQSATTTGGPKETTWPIIDSGTPCTGSTSKNTTSGGPKANRR